MCIALLVMPILANILYIPYPPVGSAATFSLAFASFLFYIGIYSSAISISEDTGLRRSIRKTAIDEFKLLDSIGTAQMSQQLQDKVGRPVKEYSDTMDREVGVQPSLSEQDAKQYLKEVIEELDKSRTQQK